MNPFKRFIEKVCSRIYRTAVLRNLHDAELVVGYHIRYVEQGMGEAVRKLNVS